MKTALVVAPSASEAMAIRKLMTTLLSTKVPMRAKTPPSNQAVKRMMAVTLAVLALGSRRGNLLKVRHQRRLLLLPLPLPRSQAPTSVPQRSLFLQAQRRSVRPQASLLTLLRPRNPRRHPGQQPRRSVPSVSQKAAHTPSAHLRRTKRTANPQQRAHAG